MIASNEMFSERLLIRKIEQSDVDFIFRLRSDKGNWRFVEFEPYTSIARAQRFMDNVLDDVNKGEVYFWILQVRETLQPIGTFCVWSFTEDRKEAELGYELLPEAQGKGYASEALEAVMKFCFESLAMNTLKAITHEKHAASIKLLVNHGFAELGYVKDLIPDAEDGPKMKLYKVNKE